MNKNERNELWIELYEAGYRHEEPTGDIGIDAEVCKESICVNCKTVGLLYHPSLSQFFEPENGGVMNEKLCSEADCLPFPFIIPGYGIITSHTAWQVFLKDYKFSNEAMERLVRDAIMRDPKGADEKPYQPELP